MPVYWIFRYLYEFWVQVLVLHFPFYSFYDDAVKFFKTNGEENCVTFEIGVCFGCMVFVVTNICYTGPKEY